MCLSQLCALGSRRRIYAPLAVKGCIYDCLFASEQLHTFCCFNVALWEYEQHRNSKCLFGLFIFYVTSVAGLLWVWNDKLRPQLLRFILLTLQGIQHKTSWNDNKNKQYIYYLCPYCYLGNRISLLQATRMVYSFQCRWSFLKFTLKQIS